MADTDRIIPDGRAPRDIAPTVRELIARLDAVELARPRLDTKLVDATLQRSLDAAGVPRRPLRWFPDSISAHRHVYAVAAAAARQAAINAPTTDLDTPAWNAAMESTWGGAWRAAHQRAPKAARHAALAVWRQDETARERSKAALLAGYAAAKEATRQDMLDTAFRAASAAAQDLAHRVSTAAFKAPPSGAGGEIDKAAAWATWRAAALRSGPWLAHDGAISAVAHLGALHAFDHPAQAAAAALFRPMVDAMEAGLFFYWVAPREVICVPRPALHAVDGLLHREDAPAVEWASGEMYFFCHGERAEPVPQVC